MLQRSFHADSELEGLYLENSMLRERVKKIGEIEPYVEVLLQNNKAYQAEINDLQAENHRLRGQLDQALEQGLHAQESHQNELALIRNGFQGDIDKLVRELKTILRDKDSMTSANQSVIEQLQTKYRRDLQTKRIKMQEQEVELSRKIKKLSDTLQYKDQLFQQKVWQMREIEVNWAEKVDKLAIECSTLAKQKTQCMQQNDRLVVERDNLARKNKQLHKQNEQTATKWLKSEQDKSEVILQLKNENRGLIEDNEALTQKSRSLQKHNIDSVRRVQNLTIQCEQVCAKNHELQSSLRRNFRAYDDLKMENEELTRRLETVSKNAQNEISVNSQYLEKLKLDNQQLNKQFVEISTDCNDKKTEISDLLRVIQKLERKVEELDTKGVDLTNQNNQLLSSNRNQSEQLEQLRLQNQNLTDKVTLYISHNDTLQKMFDREKSKKLNHQTSRPQIQSTVMNKSEELCRQYEKQIQKMVQQFMHERQVLEQNRRLELEQLRLGYESALKEKDDYFNQKIVVLEQELRALRSHI